MDWWKNWPAFSYLVDGQKGWVSFKTPGNLPPYKDRSVNLGLGRWVVFFYTLGTPSSVITCSSWLPFWHHQTRSEDSCFHASKPGATDCAVRTQTASTEFAEAIQVNTERSSSVFCRTEIRSVIYRSCTRTVSHKCLVLFASICSKSWKCVQPQELFFNESPSIYVISLVVVWSLKDFHDISQLIYANRLDSTIWFFFIDSDGSVSMIQVRAP